MAPDTADPAEEPPEDIGDAEDLGPDLPDDGAGDLPLDALIPRMVTLESTPSGAVIFEGRRRLGVTPLDVPRPAAGAEDVELRLVRKGYRVSRVRITADGPATLHEKLTPQPVAPRPEPADPELDRKNVLIDK